MMASLCACNSNEDRTKVDSASASDSASKNTSYAYTASYSSDFEMGDAKNSSRILDLWKVWEDGDLTKGQQFFADSVEMYMANGMVLRGSKDSMIATIQNYRNRYTSMKCTVAAFLPSKSKDKNEDWVSIWGKEISIDKSGKTDSVQLQETWRLNNEGKVNLMYQYARALTPPKQ